VPQERNIFKSLTVDGEPHAGGAAGPVDHEKVYGMFPRLAERKRNSANQLSGGEQQMLAVGRALILNREHSFSTSIGARPSADHREQDARD